MSCRLAEIPAVGPDRGATALVMKTPDPRAFRSGRHFAAWIGLTPKDHSTAGKTRLGVITRAGDEDLARRAGERRHGGDPAGRRAAGAITSPWLVDLLAAQGAEAGGSGAGQQERPHRLEADGDGARPTTQRGPMLWRQWLRKQIGRPAGPSSRLTPELAREEEMVGINRSEDARHSVGPIGLSTGRLDVWNSCRGNHLGQRSR